MSRSGHVRFLSTLAVALLLGLVITALLAQDPQPVPTTGGTTTPAPSASPTPERRPSPTPLPGAQNFHQWGSITVFNGLPSDAVRAIAQTPDGVMWFGTDNGLARFDGRRIQNFSLGNVESDSILALEVSPAGELWIGTREGAFIHVDNEFHRIEGMANRGVGVIFFGREFLLGMTNGNVLRVGATGRATPILSELIEAWDGGIAKVTGLAERDDRVVITTAGGGALLLRDKVLSELATTPRTPGLNALVTTPDGALWLGTDAARNASGVLAISSGRALRVAAPTARVLSLEANEGGVWAGTERYGLFQFEGTKLKKTFTFANTSGGLRSDTIYALFTDREGVLWIGTNRGVSRFDSQGPFQETVSDSPNGNFIRALFRAHDGRIYAGSNRGLFVRSGENWTPVAGYADRSIYSLGQDNEGKLVVGTTAPTSESGENGVYRTQNGQREKITDAEDVRDVYEDGENIWAATTTRGLLHAKHDPEFGWLVSAIGFEQGLPSDKAFSILPLDAGLLIATNRGVVTYRPATIAPKLIVSRILSERLHAPQEFGTTISLEYPQDSLLVEVAGQSSRTFPEQFQYAFRLKNRSGGILDSRLSKDAQYAPADLASGEYTVEAVAFDRDLNRSEPLSVRFTVARAPFPWTATALAVLLLLALVGLTWAVIEHRRIRQRNRELAAARFDLANEAERERRRIARDLHDQTLADLRNLMILSDRPHVESKEFRGEIEAVSGEIRRICEDLSPSVLENVGLVAALQFLLGRTVENHSFTAADDLDEKITMPPSVQIQVYRIVQEVLTNLRSHSTADLVEMSVDVASDANLTLSIDDNGAPFEPDESTASGRGIANIRARASLINATVRWKRRETRNRFSLTVPQRNHA